MYKVFINDSSVILLNKSESDYKLLWPKASYFDGVDVTPQMVLNEAEKAQGGTYVVIVANAEKFFNSFRSLFIMIEAAGGIVNLDNRKGPFLLIRRRGRWDLPKGKIEKGESKEHAAIREVSEECSIGKLQIKRLYDVTYHTYMQNGERFLKVTYWYRMITTDRNPPQPQKDEGIQEVKWVSADEVPYLLKDSYHSIRELMAPIING